MIVPLTHEYANYIAFNMREDDAREVLATQTSDYRHQFADECAAMGGWCLIDSGGIPVVMGGVFECWPNVGNAWCVATHDISKHGIEATKAAKFAINEKQHLHRVQAFSADFHTVSHKWLECLGFSRGATLKKFGKRGEDFIVFELLR
ncbi:hypothetical protein BWD09_07000 [Neisseria dentiae]|uniref:N-acetyltransferase n=1 Tax=Neisseria dentiae TaxID=194197 RepID=A0A1X3D9L7_9NEIS|nr:hypothetical protein [Neisseria dentiae]OSI16506.1 hypothetical protein BWD09_07000 [Neisseria dentiae]QMT44232.1 hypothetical protein H3L92_06965 [Neisseria dentiae]